MLVDFTWVVPSNGIFRCRYSLQTLTVTLLVVLLSQVVCNNAIGQTLAERIQPLVDSHRGQVSVAIQHLKSDESYWHEADRVMPTASLIKFPIMVDAYGRIANGKLSLDQRIVLKDSDKVPGSGILTEHFSDGADLSLHDVIHLMIVYSDNTATNLVVEQVGLDHLNAEMKKISLNETRMNSLVYRRDLSIDPQRSEQYGLGSTTAGEMVRLLKLLENGELHDRDSCEAMKKHLMACEDKTKIKRYLPASVQVAHKSGEISAARCEAGLIYGESGPIAICVLTAENENLEFVDDNPAHVLIGRIAEQAWRHFNPDSPTNKNERTLQTGSTGELVATLQRTLNSQLDPVPGLATDGEFGPATEDAVKNFQSAHNLEPNGVVNETVWLELGPLVEAEEVPDPVVVNATPITRLKEEPDDGAPFVTALSWVVLDGETGKRLGGLNEDARREIASTIKIMTARVVLQLVENNPEVLEERVSFSQRAAETEGSSADLRTGESVTVDELMYGLLLPSGNDAAVALAEHFGERAAAGIDAAEKLNDPFDKFILAMNEEAKKLNLKHSNFTNPNGLPDAENVSSAIDLAQLVHAMWPNKHFRRYVGTPIFGCVAQGASGHTRNVAWRNTNRLLGIESYDGVKTGTTDAAGACLVAHATRDGHQRIVVVLGCPANDTRYTDARNLFRWSWVK